MENPYSTGGGGVVLEHQYGAVLLGHLLLGDPLPELGDDVVPTMVRFQGSAFSAVDDLIVTGETPDGRSRQVSIGVRRAPLFRPSHKATSALLVPYLQVVTDHWDEVRTGRWRLALAVASPNKHVQEIRELATVAHGQPDQAAFRAAASEPRRVAKQVRDRLRLLAKLVANAAASAKVDLEKCSEQELTWRVLHNLWLRELRLEGVDQTDRTGMVARLRTIVSAVPAADRLFTKLETLSREYAPAGATVTRLMVQQRLAGTAIDIGWSDGTPVGHGSGSPLRTRYRKQVERIAPVELLDREAELAELASFCTEGHEGRYIWWRADAWAGKSALMSWFVLHPPPGVRLVSFFVTARLAGQNHRIAFIDAVLEQLAAILGRSLPHTDSTREYHLLSMLDEAAETCLRHNERLVLLVDGVDEDRGVSTDPDDYSIAGLLPVVPNHGLRVVVAGRYNPPIPDDVPDNHPLRDPSIVRPLATSPAATVIRGEAERELRRLLAGCGQDLVGLLVAARGGLTAGDLAELTGRHVREIQDELDTVVGRSFSWRPGRWRDTPSYLLAHEELYEIALDFLAPSIAGFRARLHTWFDGYQARRWPADTPEYLLRSYFDMLADSDDMARVIACATDHVRTDRMRGLSGGDQAALAEIDRAQDLVLRRQPSDVGMLARLAVHRDRLTTRNSKVPVMLPAAWALLGQPAQAEELAGSIPVSWASSAAIAFLAEAMADVGALDRARELAEHVAKLAVDAPPPWPVEGEVLAAVVRSMVAVGDLSRAISLFESLRDSSVANSSRIEMMPALISTMFDQLDITHVDRFVTSIPDAVVRARALLHLADISSSADYLAQAVDLAQAVALAPRGHRSSFLVMLAVTAAKLLGRERAEELVRSLVGDPSTPDATTIPVAAIAARTGHLDEVITTIVNLSDGDFDRAMFSLVPFLPWSDPRTSQLLERARQSGAQRYLAKMLTAVGALDQALELASEPEDPDLLASLAHCAAWQGRIDQARQLIADLWARIGGDQDSSWCTSGWSKLSEAAANAGDLLLAEHFVGLARQLVKYKPEAIRPDAIEDFVYALDRLEHIDEATELAEMITDDNSDLHRALTVEVEITGWESDEEVEELLNQGPSRLPHPTRIPEGSAVDLLTTNSWTEALPVLARDHPDLLRVIAAELDPVSIPTT
ncbi:MULTISPECIES: tetratricopeptide repeat protein [Amycolatopsis]|uniref:NACHT domain-containing protein n=1 Tax=Amycolatopsis bullii TaxID=941987 RepID=A0ABQ3KE19_9PSEU|nr:tetratricopeptide repeat protein [Amycolatopsis bullii]GHG14447.1 hypothetical protein GCM10017567_35380 [Amycolatopsis bullii]